MALEPARRVAAGAEALGVRLPRGAADRLADLTSLLEDVAVPRGFVGRADSGRILERHILDSLRAATTFVPEDRLCCDLGSGAGLPGLVLAIALPDCRFSLVESRARRAGFLELAIERLAVRNAAVALGRAEDLSLEADVATSRAFAPLDGAWRVAFGLLRPGGRLVYFAGEALQDPVAEAGALEHPEPPASVQISTGLETRAPLVIMTRG